MSVFRAGVLLAAAVMLLPVEERKQAELASAASATAERTATFCERSPSTCATGRDLWALFLRKAEFGVELGAKLLRDQLLGGSSAPQREVSVAPLPVAVAPVIAPVKASAGAQPPRKVAYPMDHPPRWR